MVLKANRSGISKILFGIRWDWKSQAVPLSVFGKSSFQQFAFFLCQNIPHGVVFSFDFYYLIVRIGFVSFYIEKLVAWRRKIPSILWFLYDRARGTNSFVKNDKKLKNPLN